MEECKQRIWQLFSTYTKTIQAIKFVDSAQNLCGFGGMGNKCDLNFQPNVAPRLS
jgi:hypothetical protein